jgi:hypothetical protein
MVKKSFNNPHANRRDTVAMIKMLTPLFFILGIGGLYHEFIVNAVKANVAINSGIMLVTAYGIALIIARLISAQHDFRVIERFGHEAGRGVHMKTLLEQPWLKRRYVRHYLSHIANTGGTLASQMDQSAIESELHALQSEYDSKMELPQFLVGFMIAMGLLGTFIGLLETLTGIAGMLDSMGGSGTNVEAQFMKLVVELRKPLAGMGIAFSASMFGLVTSLLLAVMMTNLRRYVSRVIALARNVMHELVEHSRAPGVTVGTKNLSPDDIAKMKVATPESPNAMSNSHIVGRFDVFFKKMDLVLESFESSIASTQKMTDLLGFGPRMKEISERTLEEIKIMSVKHSEQQKYLQKLIEVSSESTRAANTLVESQGQAAIELKVQLSTLAEKLSKIEDVSLGGSRHLWDIKENVAKLSKAFSMVEIIASGVSGQTSLLESLVEEARGTQGTLSSMHQDLRNAREDSKPMLPTRQ